MSDRKLDGLRYDIKGLDDRKRAAAFSVLYNRSVPGSEQVLEELYASENKIAKVFFCHWLASQQTNSRTLEILDAFLIDKNPFVQREAADAVMQLDLEKISGYLLKLLKTRNDFAIVFSVDILAHMRSTNAIALFQHQYDTYSEKVKLKVIQALRIIGSPTAYFALRNFLKREPQISIKAEILKAISYFHWMISPKIFRKYLYNDSVDLRIIAAWSLSKFKSRKVANILIQRYAKESQISVKEQIIKSLESQSSSSALSFLINVAAFDPEPNIRLIASWALDQYQDIFTKYMYISNIKNPNPKMRALVYQKIPFFEDKKIPEYLRRGILQDKDENVREAAALGIGLLKDSGSEMILKQAIKEDSSILVRYTASLSLMKIWDKSDFEDIYFLLNLPEDQYSVEQQVVFRSLTRHFLLTSADVTDRFIDFLAKKLDSDIRNIRYLCIETIGTIRSLYAFERVFNIYRSSGDKQEKNLAGESMLLMLKRDFLFFSEIIEKEQFSLDELTDLMRIIEEIQLPREQMHQIKMILLHLASIMRTKQEKDIVMRTFADLYKKYPEKILTLLRSGQMDEDQYFSFVCKVREKEIVDIGLEFIFKKIETGLVEEKIEAMKLLAQLHIIDAISPLIHAVNNESSKRVIEQARKALKTIVGGHESEK